MFTQKDQELVYAMAVKKAAGDADVFLKKMTWLKNRWEKELKKDSTAGRLIAPIIFRQTTPINVSIIADNIDYFRDRYQEACGDDLERALQRACLCGSRNVADFLLEKLGSSYIDKGCEYVLAYACASMNEEWIREIASAMANAHREMPNLVFLFEKRREKIHAIQDIFSNKPTKIQRK